VVKFSEEKHWLFKDLSNQFEHKDDAERIKDLLKKVTLFQFGKYSQELLNRELTDFLRYAEEAVCKALRPNGAICFKEYAEEYGPAEAKRLCESDASNWARMGVGGKLIAELIRLSTEFEGLEMKSLSDKILLFDKVIHAEHYAGAFKDYLPSEKSIFNVDILKIKQEADKELMSSLFKG
jgi:hypothetical protein